MSALYTGLADGDYTADPIVDAARAIVDGHIVRSRQLSEQSIFPAIDVGKSLSRVMADVVSDQHRNAASAFRRLWAAYEENRDLILMGAYRPGNDPVIDTAVARRPELLEFLRKARTVERRVGKERVSTCRSRLWPLNEKKKKK